MRIHSRSTTCATGPGAPSTRSVQRAEEAVLARRPHRESVDHHAARRARRPARRRRPSRGAGPAQLVATSTRWPAAREPRREVARTGAPRRPAPRRRSAARRRAAAPTPPRAARRGTRRGRRRDRSRRAAPDLAPRDRSRSGADAATSASASAMRSGAAVGGKQDPGVAHRLGDRAVVAGDDRPVERHGLEQRDADALVLARGHERGRAPRSTRRAAAGRRPADESHAGKAQLGQLRAERTREASVARRGRRGRGWPPGPGG